MIRGHVNLPGDLPEFNSLDLSENFLFKHIYPNDFSCNLNLTGKIVPFQSTDKTLFSKLVKGFICYMFLI